MESLPKVLVEVGNEIVQIATRGDIDCSELVCIDFCLLWFTGVYFNLQPLVFNVSHEMIVRNAL